MARIVGRDEVETFRKVLLVEDDEDMRVVLAGVLERAGYEVVSAANGAEAIQRMRVVRPDVVVLDLMMPVMDGWQFRIAQRRDVELAGTPVVALSASETPQARAVDAAAYLSKPVDPRILLRTVEEVIVLAERRRDEVRLAQTERMAALGTLAAGIAHEINNPLTYVLLHLENIARLLPRMTSPGHGDELTQLRASLAAAIEGSERIRGVMDGVRTFGRIGDTAVAPVDVRWAVDGALKLVMNELRHRATLVKDYRDVPIVSANEGRLVEVFLNLLTNAIQSIPDGNAASNEIRIIAETDAAGNAVVAIADSGSGIPERILGRIFEPFFSTKPMGQGHGLGLSIAYGIVSSLHGQLSVASEIGRGTVMRVTLPPYKTTSAIDEPVKPIDPPAASRAARRILVIDDDRTLADALATALRSEHEVETANNGREALELLARDDRFDAILCDLNMPEMSGAELIERLRAVRPALLDRIILMTGGAFTSAARDLLQRDDHAAITKPIDLPRLRALLATPARDRAGRSRS